MKEINNSTSDQELTKKLKRIADKLKSDQNIITDLRTEIFKYLGTKRTEECKENSTCDEPKKINQFIIVKKSDLAKCDLVLEANTYTNADNINISIDQEAKQIHFIYPSHAVESPHTTTPLYGSGNTNNTKDKYDNIHFLNNLINNYMYKGYNHNKAIVKTYKYLFFKMNTSEDKNKQQFYETTYKLYKKIIYKYKKNN